MEDNRQRNAQNFGVVLSHEEGQEKRLTRCGEAVKEMVSDALAEMACVSGERTEDGLDASKMSTDDGEQDGQTDVKTCVFEGEGKSAGEVRLDRDIKVNSADDQLIVMEHCAGAGTSAKTGEVASPALEEVEQEAAVDSKSILNMASFNDASNKSSAYNLRNDQVRDSDL